MTKSTDTLLIVFIKNPVAGKVKTRLAATLGNEQALKVYERLLEHTRTITGKLQCDKIVYYSDFLPENDKWKAIGFFQAIQSGGDLGRRMKAAFQHAFSNHYRSVMIVGSDCFELTTSHLEKAMAALDSSEAVLGPAHDGGYYLLGMTKMLAPLFVNKEWSSSSVLSQTTDELQSMNVSFTLLETLHDIDNEEDLFASNMGPL